MSRADAGARMVDAAILIGVREGVGALTLQNVATESAVSKALVLYHHRDKDALLLAVVQRLAARDADALRAAASDTDVLESWRRVAGDAEHRAERALLVGLLQEASLRPAAPAVFAMRALASTELALALLAAADLRPRIADSLIGRVLLQHLDGLAVSGREREAGALDADLDATALSLLGLGS